MADEYILWDITIQATAFKLYDWLFASLLHDNNDCILSYFMSVDLQLNLSTMATLGTEGSGHCKEVAIAERLKQE